MAEERMATGRVSGIFVVSGGSSLAPRLGRALQGEPDLAISGVANTVADALETIVQLKPDLLLVELSPDGLLGVEAVREFRDARPRMKLLARSGTAAPRYAQQVIDAGADGYILRSDGMRQLIQAMRDVLGGHLYVSDRVIEGD
jgi:DNA-binding NarL/FixJ family response regulator